MAKNCPLSENIWMCMCIIIQCFVHVNSVYWWSTLTRFLSQVFFFNDFLCCVIMKNQASPKVKIRLLSLNYCLSFLSIKYDEKDILLTTECILLRSRYFIGSLENVKWKTNCNLSGVVGPIYNHFYTHWTVWKQVDLVSFAVSMWAACTLMFKLRLLSFSEPVT